MRKNRKLKKKMFFGGLFFLGKCGIVNLIFYIRKLEFLLKNGRGAVREWITIT